MKYSTFIVLCLLIFGLNQYALKAEDPKISTQEVDSLNQKAWDSRAENTEMSLRYGQDALAKGLKIKYFEGIAKSHSYIGVAYRNQGNYNQALKHFFEALKIAESNNLQTEVAYSHINIANIYYLQTKLPEAEKYLGYALKTAQKLTNDDILAYIYINYARLFRKEDSYQKALNYTDKVLEIRKKQKESAKIMAVYSEKGKIYRDMGQYEDAIHQLHEALYIALANEYTLDVISCYHHLSRTYLYANNYAQAKHYARMSLMLHPEMAGIHLRQNNYDILYQIYKNTKEYDKALEYHELWTRSQDSIKTAEYNKNLGELRVRYDSQQQEQENKILREHNDKQSFVVMAMVAFAFLLLLIVYLLYRNNRRKIEDNRKLAEQQEEILKNHQALTQKNEEVQQQAISLQQANNQIHKQHFDITSSINYAKRIQEAVLPELTKIQEYLPEFFVFYRPRNIVSGDFYFFDARQDCMIISAIDCTGHGVPGAFMSLIANDLLSNILLTQKNPSPDKILNLLHLNVKITLRQDSNHGQDGMDMAICVIYPNRNLVEFAGAKSPLFYMQHTENQLIKGDIMPIGGYKNSLHQKRPRHYTKHRISIHSPTTFYMYSDGFQDQFGGKKGKKLMSRTFRNLLHDIHQLPLNQQHQQLEQTLDQWMLEGDFEQIDDILVMGFRLHPTN